MISIYIKMMSLRRTAKQNGNKRGGGWQKGESHFQEEEHNVSGVVYFNIFSQAFETDNRKAQEEERQTEKRCRLLHNYKYKEEKGGLGVTLPDETNVQMETYSNRCLSLEEI